nr:synaptobrevin, longin-like domain protein [Tanacetum cinerariifolium]
MVAILEKGEFNSDFHLMVDFIAASHLRYALIVKPTIFVSHIRQFWSNARIETMDEGTHILATVDVKPTIFVSHIRQFWSTAKIKTTDEGTHILATVDGIQRTVSESSLRRNLKLRDEDGIVSIPDTELFENLTLMGYNNSQNQKLTFQKGQFSHQWKYLIHTIMQCLSPKSTGFNEFSSNIVAALVCLATNRTYNFSKIIFDDEPASPVRDVSEGEACPTDSGFIADQDRATIAKSSTLPHDSAPRAQEGEIVRLKERVQVLEDREGVATKQSRDDALIKGRSINEGEAAAERIKSTEKANDQEVEEGILYSYDQKQLGVEGKRFQSEDCLPLPEEKRCHCHKFALLLKKRRRNYQSKIDGSYTKIVPHVLPMILAVTVKC